MSEWISGATFLSPTLLICKRASGLDAGRPGKPPRFQQYGTDEPGQHWMPVDSNKAPTIDKAAIAKLRADPH